MSDLPSGTVTFLFTDIEGSTALWERDRPMMVAAVERHLALLTTAITTHGGTRFKTVGDSVQAAFPAAPCAVAAAFDAQRVLLDEDWGEIAPLRVRMAVHAGEAAPDPHGDYLAAPLNRLARLLSAGHGGQILLSQSAQQLTRGALPNGAELRDLGEHRLRDLIEPERVYQVLHPDLPEQFPPLTTLASLPNNLPRQPTPFLGRERAVAAITALLGQDDVQLVTLTGPGGTGKTRLALQVAVDCLDAFPEGVFFVDLAPLTDPTLVASAMATALGMPSDRAASPADAVAAFLRDRQVLLLLDNFEHLLDGAHVVSDLLRHCARVKVLATSRAPLRLRAEHDVPVSPLGLPDMSRLEPVEQLTQYEAVRLFIERAIAAKSDFTVDNANAPAVAEICARLDGLPLAIELAAARVRMLPPQALLRRLEHRLPLLTGGARDAPQRQRTLRDAIAWSHELLSADEQVLFRRLGVFAGGCTLDLAEAVVNPDGALDVFAGLASLIEEGLLRQEVGTSDDPRFRMLETIREFALEQLVASGEEPEIRHQLAAWFVGQSEEFISAFETTFPLAIIDRLDADYPNLAASLRWLEQTDQRDDLLRLVSAVADFWFVTGRSREGRAWSERALALAQETPSQARVMALSTAGDLAHRLGDDEVAATRLDESAALARQLDLPRYEAIALLTLGILDEDRGDYDAAESQFLAAAKLFRQVQPEIELGAIPYHLGILAYGRGETDRAKQLWEEALATVQAQEESVVAGWCLEYLALLAAEQGDHGAAAEALRAVLALSQSAARRQQQGAVLDTVAVLSTACELFETAARLQGAAAAIEWQSGRAAMPESLAYERVEARLRSVLGEEGYARARKEGAALRPEDVSAAIETVLDVAAARKPSDDLIARTET